jgi:hypothetical protein
MANKESSNDSILAMVHQLALEHAKAVGSLDKLLTQLNTILVELKDANIRHNTNTEVKFTEVNTQLENVGKLYKYLIIANVVAICILLISVKDTNNFLSGVIRFVVNIF